MELLYYEPCTRAQTQGSSSNSSLAKIASKSCALPTRSFCARGLFSLSLSSPLSPFLRRKSTSQGRSKPSIRQSRRADSLTRSSAEALRSATTRRRRPSSALSHPPLCAEMAAQFSPLGPSLHTELESECVTVREHAERGS